jgi:hypothetical protein
MNRTSGQPPAKIKSNYRRLFATTADGRALKVYLRAPHGLTLVPGLKEQFNQDLLLPASDRLH